MNGPSDASARPPRFEVRGILHWFQRNTFVALVLLLLLFIAIVDLLKPGTVNPVWLSNTLLFAAPLGHSCRGSDHGDVDRRDRSVGRQRRHRSAFLMTTDDGPEVRQWSGGRDRLGLGLAVGAINGVGVALLGVQPLVMTLGTGLMTEGIIIVYSQRILASRSIVPDFIHAIGSDRLGGLIPLDMFLWLPIAVLVVVTLRHTGFGRLLYAIGDNSEGCRWPACACGGCSSSTI